MYALELDRSKRLLVISAAQRVTAEEANRAAQRIRELLQDRTIELGVVACDLPVDDLVPRPGDVAHRAMQTTGDAADRHHAGPYRLLVEVADAA